LAKVAIPEGKHDFTVADDNNLFQRAQSGSA
jgi:hypothetical protein